MTSQPGSLSPSAQRVQEALERHGIPCRVVELPGSTRTALEAAQAVGCDVAQIVKSLVFQGQESGRPVLILTSGANRVKEKKAAPHVGEPIIQAPPDYVREKTGFAIGGVPPVAHAQEPLTLIDQDLLAWPEVWAAAGTPHAVFSISPADLVQITGGRVIPVQ